jgi:hypothetical protein
MGPPLHIDFLGLGVENGASEVSDASEIKLVLELFS